MTSRFHSSEEWRPVVGYEYAVSDRGRVYSLPRGRRRAKEGNMLKLREHAGYSDVALCRDREVKAFLVHRLVAAAFIGPCPDGHEVDHINSDRRDNRRENLRYLTHADNARHAGEEHGASILTEADVGEIKVLCQSRTQVSVAAMYGVHSSTVNKIMTGVNWRHLL